MKDEIKIPHHVKVRVFGDGWSDSFDIVVKKDLNMYRLSTLWPCGTENNAIVVCGYEVNESIFNMVGDLYGSEPISSVNFSWFYEEET